MTVRDIMVQQVSFLPCHSSKRRREADAGLFRWACSGRVPRCVALDAAAAPVCRIRVRRSTCTGCRFRLPACASWRRLLIAVRPLASPWATEASFGGPATSSRSQ